MAITVKATELIGMLTDLVRTTSPDDTLLTAVQLFGADNGGSTVLVGYSTDRYVMGQAWAPAEDGGGLEPSPVQARELATVMAVLKPWRTQVWADVTLAREGDDKLAFECNGTRFVATVLLDVAFPKASRLLTMPDEAGQTIAYQPKNMEKFTAIARRRKEELTLTPAVATRGTQVHIGAQYRGVIMPRILCAPISTLVFEAHPVGDDQARNEG
jgi:hypothetical protein